MPQPIRIQPVEGFRDLVRFIRLTEKLYADDPNFIQPLLVERLDYLSRKKNPYFDHAETQLWSAWRGDRPVGRISAQIDNLVLEHIHPGLGQFGFFDCENDPEVAAALFETAESWLREHGMTKSQGPYSLSINSECGLLVDGFSTPSYFMMNQAPPYAENLLHACGYEAVKEMYAYEVDTEIVFPKRIMKIIEMAENNPRLRLRRIDMKHYEEEIFLAFSIFNDAWANNWGFVPFTNDEIAHTAKAMRPLVDENRTRFCEYDGEAICFMTAVVDVNYLIRVSRGKLFPFNYLYLLYKMLIHKDISRLRVPLMGVRQKYQNTIVGAAAAFYCIEYIRAFSVTRGVKHGELSWVLEDNRPMRNLSEQIRANIYKTYRLYEKALASGSSNEAEPSAPPET